MQAIVGAGREKEGENVGPRKEACGSETKNFGRAAPIWPACAARKTRAGKTSQRLSRT